MQILKIHDGKGSFSLDGVQWKPIDEIGKEDLMSMVDSILKSAIEMDVYNEANLANQAHQIIYKGIYDKLTALQKDKNKFRDESHRLYLDAIRKYEKKEDIKEKVQS
ncbi:MAG: hypothetical protein ABII64_02410 [Elusimicrobiota bacterium]